METAMLEAGPRLVMEAATGIIKQTTVLLSRSAAVGKTTGTFLEWAQENREKLDVFAQSLVKLLIPCFKKKKKGGKAWRSEPHTSVTALRTRVCTCIYACLFGY